MTHASFVEFSLLVNDYQFQRRPVAILYRTSFGSVLVCKSLKEAVADLTIGTGKDYFVVGNGIHVNSRYTVRVGMCSVRQH